MRTQQLIGLFALLTLMLAGAAIGRHLGLTLGAAVYGSALILTILLTILYRRAIRKGRG